MWKNFKVIDADAHTHEPQYLWQRYVEPKYRDQVPKVAFMVYEPDGKFVLSRIRNRRGVGKMTARSKQREFQPSLGQLS